MPAARYWRAVGLRGYGGGDVDLSALQLYEAESGDGLYPSVSLLLHFDGAAGSVVFADKSGSPKTVTPIGAASISTNNYKFGGSSLACGSGCILVPHDDTLHPVSADFTIELWARATSIPASGLLFVKANGTDGDYPYQAFVTTSGAVVFRGYTAGVERFTVTTPSGIVTVGGWAHLAFCRQGSAFSVFVDGVLRGTASYSGALTSHAHALSVGAYSTGSYPFVGHIDDFRFTTGVCRYSGAFMPPVAPFPNDVAAGAVVRIDQLATLTCTAGSATHLQDGISGTTTRLPARNAGLAVVWDFGAGAQKEPVLAAVGAAADANLFLSHFDLQSSDDGLAWTQRAVLGRFLWPGPYALTDPQAPSAWIIVEADSPLHMSVAASAAVPPHSAGQFAPLGMARDVEFGGFGVVSGTVERDADPVDLPMRRRVRLFDERSGLLVRETWSDAATGAYSFAGLDAARTYTVIAYDHEHHYRAVIADNMTPEAAP